MSTGVQGLQQTNHTCNTHHSPDLTSPDFLAPMHGMTQLTATLPPRAQSPPPLPPPHLSRLLCPKAQDDAELLEVCVNVPLRLAPQLGHTDPPPPPPPSSTGDNA
jgi:hypothetical protein